MNEIFHQTGINITNQQLQLVEIAKEENHYRISNLNEIIFNEPINFETQKDTLIAAQLQSAFDEIQLTNPIKATSLSFTLPPELFITLQLPYDNSLVHSDLIEEFKWELSLLYPFVQPEELVLQYHEIEKNMIVTKNSAVVMGLNKKFIRLLKDFCNRNNLSLRFIDCAPVAANSAVRLSEYNVKEATTLNIYTSANSCCIIFSIGMRPVYVKTIFKNSASDFIDAISEELLSSPERKINKELIAESYINGTDLSDELLSRLFEKTGLIFHVFNPFHRTGLEQELLNKYQSKEKLNSFAPAAGIAFRLA